MHLPGFLILIYMAKFLVVEGELCFIVNGLFICFVAFESAFDCLVVYKYAD